MNDLREKLEGLKKDCNFFVYGRCNTSACYSRGGYKRGMSQEERMAIIPTCDIKDILSGVDALVQENEEYKAKTGPQWMQNFLDIEQQLAEAQKRCVGLDTLNAHLETRVKDLRKQYEEAEAGEEALHEKLKSLAPHGTCGCSLDKKDDICFHHSPQLRAKEQEVAELIHLHEVTLGLTELKYLNELTEENAEEYSDYKLYERWREKWKR